jgi:hypothetical protein
MSYDVATWADTSFNQASKDPGQLRRGYSNLGKIYCINTVIPVAAKIVDATLVAEKGRILPENSRFPTSSDQPKVPGSNHHFQLVTSSFSIPTYLF